MNNYISLPDNFNRILQALGVNGFEAYIVGGCVRDRIRGAEPSDYDITTSALPEQVERIFADYRIIETGLKHGTVTVLMDGEPFEITTFRTDGTYSDARHPDNVSFTLSVEDDLARRDFTMNAIAYSPQCGLTDPFGGADDISNGIIRAVGNAGERFREDALRIIRGLRFSAVLGYSIEPETARAMRENAPLLNKISGERLFTECKKLLCGSNAGNVIREYYDILDVIFPGIAAMHGFEQHNPYHIHDVLEHTIRVVENTPSEPIIRLAALLHDIGKPDCFTMDEQGIGHFRGHAAYSIVRSEAIFNRLKADNETRTEVLTIVKYHDIPIEPRREEILHRLRQFDARVLRLLFDIKRADVLGQNTGEIYRARLVGIAKCRELMEELLREQACFSIRDLAVNGRDLIAIGYEPGIQLGKMLETLLEEVISGRLPNEKRVLLEYAARP